MTRHGARRGTLTGSGPLLGFLRVASVTLAVASSACGSSEARTASGDTGGAATAQKALDSGVLSSSSGSRVNAVDAAVTRDAKRPDVDSSPGVAASASSVSYYQSSGGALVDAASTPTFAGDAAAADGGTHGGVNPDASSPFSCLFNGLLCDGSVACCAGLCERGTCGGCCAEGVVCPGGNCCSGLPLVTPDGGTEQYCGTNLCVPDGHPCGSPGNKPCCNDDCGGSYCGVL